MVLVTISAWALVYLILQLAGKDTYIHYLSSILFQTTSHTQAMLFPVDIGVAKRYHSPPVMV